MGVENKGLLKNTFILSAVQIINIIIKAAQNKIAAIILGPSGMGIVGLYLNSMNFITISAGLGISQSAVRDIAAADAKNDSYAASFICTVTDRIVLITGILGLCITLVLAYPLSIYVFGDKSYALGYVILAFAVFFNIVSEGRLAILKGKRKFVDLAKCTITGSIVGFLVVVPIYYFFKESGITWALLLIATAQFIYVRIYVGRYRYVKQQLSLKQLFSGAHQMVKMGISLMIVSLVNIAFNLVIASFIRSGDSLSNVGIYTAGSTILTAYFGVLITSMSTDFYPRVSASYEDNAELQKILNNQCISCLSLLFPIVVAFVFAAPLFISFLYSDEFIRAAEYTDYAMLGTILLTCSNFMGIILLAKQKSRIFLTSVFAQRIFLLIVYCLFYNLWEIKGLGYAYIVTGLSDLLLMTYILNHYFHIILYRKVYYYVVVILLFTLMSMFVKEMQNSLTAYTIGGVLFLSSCIISYIVFRQVLHIDIVSYVRNRIKK